MLCVFLKTLQYQYLVLKALSISSALSLYTHHLISYNTLQRVSHSNLTIMQIVMSTGYKILSVGYTVTTKLRHKILIVVSVCCFRMRQNYDQIYRYPFVTYTSVSLASSFSRLQSAYLKPCPLHSASQDYITLTPLTQCIAKLYQIV